MSTNSEINIVNILSTLTHPGSLKNLSLSVSKIIVRDEILYFTIYDDGATEAQLEHIKAKCEQILKNSFSFQKIAISLSQRPSQVALEPNARVAQKAKYKLLNVNKIIVIASGKGGVGKSTIAFNLALALSALGNKVGIVDVDIHGPSLAKIAAISQKPALKNEFMLPIKKFGIEMMSVSFLVNKKDPLVWRGPMTSKMLYQLMMMTKWGAVAPLDYLIVDTPPGTGDVHLSLGENYALDGAIVVSTPQDIALADVVKGIGMFNKLNLPVLGIIENMSFFQSPDGQKHYIFGKDGAKKLAQDLNVELLAQLPIFEDLRIASDAGKPIIYYNPAHEISLIFEKIAKGLAYK